MADAAIECCSMYTKVCCGQYRDQAYTLGIIRRQIAVVLWRYPRTAGYVSGLRGNKEGWSERYRQTLLGTLLSLASDARAISFPSCDVQDLDICR